MSGALLHRPGTARRRRLSPIGIVHGVAARYGRPEDVVAHTDGPLRQWCTGVARARDQVRDYADFWREHNRQALAEPGPLWVALGDSTAQGVGASHPLAGYVGRAHGELVCRSGRPWRVVNLSRSGALAADVLTQQLPAMPALPAGAALVTCGIGSNDILATPPRRLHETLRALIAGLPDCAVMLDLPLPDQFWGFGRLVSPYVAGVNRTIHTAALARGLRVAELSRHYMPPWEGKFAADRFHPSDLGYRDQARAVLAAVLVE